MFLILLTLELQVLEIGERGNGRLQGEFRPARLEHVVHCPELDRQHLVPLPHLLHQSFHVILPVVPGVDPLLRLRMVGVVGPPVLAFIVGFDLDGR